MLFEPSMSNRFPILAAVALISGFHLGACTLRAQSEKLVFDTLRAADGTVTIKSKTLRQLPTGAWGEIGGASEGKEIRFSAANQQARVKLGESVRFVLEGSIDWSQNTLNSVTDENSGFTTIRVMKNDSLRAILSPEKTHIRWLKPKIPAIEFSGGFAPKRITITPIHSKGVVIGWKIDAGLLGRGKKTTLEQVLF